MKKVIAGIVAAALISTSVFAEWKHFSKKDKMSDKQITVIYSRSTNYIPNVINQPDRATLYVRCEDKKLSDIYVDWENYIDSAGATHVTVRWDKNKPVDEPTLPSTDNTATFFGTSDNPRIVKNMKKHNKVVIRAYPWRKAPVTAEFSLQGFTKTYETYCK